MWRAGALYVQRQEPSGATTVLTSPSMFQEDGDMQVVLTGVTDFEIKGDFMFASKKNKADVSAKLGRASLITESADSCHM